jgi:serine/threonine protein kinase
MCSNEISDLDHSLHAVISAAVVAILVTFCLIIYCVKRGHFSSNAMVCYQSGAKNFQIIDEEIMKNCGSIAPKRYTYSDVKKLTNSFKDKIGQGGYGVVYKGKLPDGRMVAVKILNKSKGNGEEFINEVASISRTSHVNIVTLLGFCYERTKRALIYEFMPNGSLDKFIYDKGSPITNCHLDSKTMFQIAVGIARGLEYLHRGCNTRILHFDIKPHNILLDEDLLPKISDFGLAKRCKTKESIVLLTGMRGTAGFIAPEVFSRTLAESLTSLTFTAMECWFLKWLEEEKILMENSLIPVRHIFHTGFI